MLGFWQTSGDDSFIKFDHHQLNTQHYKECIKGKWSNPEKGVAPSPTPWCSIYGKRSVQVAFAYGCQL